jgi:hypothetical protein
MRVVVRVGERTLPVEVLTGTESHEGVRVGQGGKDTDPEDCRLASISKRIVKQQGISSI